jgi:hypothetical protein
MFTAFIFSIEKISKIEAEGPNFDLKVSGNIEFGIIFDKEGLRLFDKNTTKHSSLFSFDITIKSEKSSDFSSLKLFFKPGDWGSVDEALNFYSAEYLNDYMKFLYANYSYNENFSKYFLGNWYDEDDEKALDPLGDKYLKANMDFMNLEMIFLPIENKIYTRNALDLFVDVEEEESFVIDAKIFAAKTLQNFDYFDFDLKTGLWVTNSNIQDLIEENVKFVGSAFELNFTGKDNFFLDGLYVYSMFGFQGVLEKNNYSYEDIILKAHSINLGYNNKFKILESNFFNLKFNPIFSYVNRKDIKNMIFSSEKDVEDSEKINLGINFDIDLDNLGIFSIYNDIEYLFEAVIDEYDDSQYNLFSFYGFKYENTKLHDLSKIKLDLRKKYSHYLNVPLGILVELYGDYDKDFFDINYTLMIAQNGLKNNNHVLIEDFFKIIENNNLAYKFSLSVKPLTQIKIISSITNYTLNKKNIYTINSFKDFIYSLDFTFSPDEIITAGFHLSNGSNFENLKNIEWHLFAGAKFEF